jgi:hypothetical protein
MCLFRRRLLLLLLTSAIGAFTAQARTWTDLKGRTLEADLVSANAVTLTLRLLDGHTFELPLAQLSPVDRAFASASFTKPAAFDFEAFNTLIGLPLFTARDLWDEKPATVAARLRLPAEGQTPHFESYRTYPRSPLKLLGTQAYTVSLQASEGRITTLTAVFANRGDYPAFKSQDERTFVSKADLKAFDQTLKADFDTLNTALTQRLGPPSRETSNAGLDVGRRTLRWLIGPHALLITYDPEQMVGLKIIPADFVATARLADDQLRRILKSRITHRPNGDVILEQVPMISQGPKGYCVPATFERYLRYVGISADMYELAMTGGTDFGGGTSFQTMAQGIDRFVRRQVRRLDKVDLKLTATGLARYLDEGRPLIWGLYSTSEFNKFSNAHTAARAIVTDWPAWKKISTASSKKAALTPDINTGHACLIIGYNLTSNEIAFTDSWGPDFTERWIPADAAQKITQDEYWLIAW